jgi:hypothetical protein
MIRYIELKVLYSVVCDDSPDTDKDLAEVANRVRRRVLRMPLDAAAAGSTVDVAVLPPRPADKPAMPAWRQEFDATVRRLIDMRYGGTVGMMGSVYVTRADAERYRVKSDLYVAAVEAAQKCEDFTHTPEYSRAMRLSGAAAEGFDVTVEQLESLLWKEDL